VWSPNIFVEICGTGEVVGPDDDLRLAIAAVTVENILHLFHFQDRDSTDDEDHKGGMLRWMTFLSDTRGESESTDQCESESGEGVGWGGCTSQSLGIRFLNQLWRLKRSGSRCGGAEAKGWTQGGQRGGDSSP
jgi:hypothetical protein